LRSFDAIVCWKFDRFARSVSHLLRAVETFKALGIEFVSLSEQVDTSTPTGKMIFTVLGAVAELERSLIAERVRAGLRNARAKGMTLGRPRKRIDLDEIKRLRSAGFKECVAQAARNQTFARQILTDDEPPPRMASPVSGQETTSPPCNTSPAFNPVSTRCYGSIKRSRIAYRTVAPLFPVRSTLA
jgi:Resolvase, N terminal domain